MKTKLRENGFTLVEVLIGAGLLAVGIAAGEYYFVSYAQETLKQRGFSSRDKVLSTIRTASGMAASLRNTFVAAADTNSQFIKCLTASPTFAGQPVSPGDCPNGVTTPLALSDPLATQVVGLSVGGGAYTGTQSKPLYYNLEGEACTPSSSSTNTCLMQVWTEFTPQCPPTSVLGPPAPACDVAELITVQYHVEPISGLSSPMLTFSKTSGQFTVTVAQITGATPAIDTVLPIPPPLPPVASTGTGTGTGTGTTGTSGSGGGSGSSGGSDGSSGSGSGGSASGSSGSNPTSINCPSPTHQYGNGCNCPPGQALSFFPFGCVVYGI